MSDRDRRRHDRHEVDGLRGTIAATPARVADISLEGLAIEVSEALQVGRTYPLSLTHRDRTVRAEVTVAWSSLVGTEKNELGDVKPVYRAGVHVDKILGGSSVDLYQFIADTAVISPGSALFGRYTVDAAEARQPGLTADFSVSKMSLSGLLLETEVAPDVGTQVTLQMVLGDQALEARGRVLRVEQVERQSGYHMVAVAVAFAGLAGDTRALLAEFIRGYLV